MTDFVFTHSPVLGTLLTVVVANVEADVADAIDRRVVGEIDRLEALLSRYRPDSALERWKHDELVDVPVEFSMVMRRAAAWTARTDGALDPRAGALTELWRRAATLGRRPREEDLDPVLRRLAGPGFEIDSAGEPRRLGDCTDLDLHAFAKGWIVDRSLSVAVHGAGEAAIVVNAGGDVARTGPGESIVAIDDPFRPYDNAAPIDRVVLSQGGLATSGNARRSVEIGGRRFSHIVDPRTGEPAEGAVSVSVIADSAEAADAWATALTIIAPDVITTTADGARVAAMAVLADRTMIANDRWRRHRSDGVVR